MIHGGGSLARTITLVRHAETESNRAGTWQGQSDSPLSVRGRDQVARLGERLRGQKAALVVASDLGRTRATAKAIGPAEPDPAWREFDLGTWDNLRPEDIKARHPELERSRFGKGDFQPEGGERFTSFISRVRAAFDTIAARLDDGESAVVVTHGGVVQTVVGSLLGVPDQAAMLVPANASLTTIALDDDRSRLVTYSDDLHLNGDVARPSGTRIRLFRHGQTLGNREGRWFGQTETPLTDEGRRQAERLAESAAPVDAIVSSPLSRTRETAAPLAVREGLNVAVVDGFAEFYFGDWEGLTASEIRDRFPDEYQRIHVDGNDEPRGGGGETFAAVGRRMAAAAEEVASNGAGTVGVFTHGGATRAYAAHLLGVPFANRDLLPVPRNTAHMEVIWTGGAGRLSSYNVAAHLGD